MSEDPWFIPKWFGLYVFIGICWATLKWIQFAVRRRTKYAKCLAEWNNERNTTVQSINDIPLVDRADFLRDVMTSFRYDDDAWSCYELDTIKRDYSSYPSSDGAPSSNEYRKLLLRAQNKVMAKALSSPLKHKECITVWLSAWPFSMLSSFVFEYIADFYRFIGKLISKFFVALSKAAMGKYRGDFANVSIESEE